MRYTPSSETAEQQAVIRWARIMEFRYPELQNLFHVPNEAKRTKTTAAVLKSMGLKAGVPDLLLDAPKGAYHGLRIEMKYGNNRPSTKQLEWLTRLQQAGYCVGICYGADAAIAMIEDYLKLQDGSQMRYRTNSDDQKYGIIVMR